MAVLAERNAQHVNFSTPVQEKGGRSKRKNKGGSARGVSTPGTPKVRRGDGEEQDAAAGGGGGICGLLSPNCDSQERKTARQRKRESIEARIAMLTPHRKKRADADVDDMDEGDGGPSKRGGRTAAIAMQNMLKNDQILDLYKSCIKLASENKINTKNTWSLQLIDHLSDIVHDEEEGPNFQKASCTLDAGVKIYSSRVDSTHSETFKVLGGLSKSKNSSRDDDDNEDDDDDDDDTEGGEKPPNTVEKRRRGKRGAEVDKDVQTVDCFTANIEDDDSLQAKELATAYNTDPLFAKMSAAFDEGGGKGMLLHNLPCLRGCELAFDANERPLEKLECSTHDAAMDESYSRSLMSDEIKVDLTEFCTEVASVWATFAKGTEQLRITPSYDRLTAMGRSGGMNEDDAEIGTTGTQFLIQRQSAGGCENDVDDDMDSFQDDGMMDSWDDDDDDDDSVDMPGNGGPSNAMFAFASLSVNASEEDSGGVNAAEWLESLSGVGSSLAGKRWAGMSHWRYRAPAPSQSAGEDQATGEEDSKKKSKARSAPDYIDFHAPDTVPDSAFEVAKDPSKLCVTDKTLNSVADTLLPEDFHYEAKSLGRLFLKPRVPLKKLMRHVSAAMNSSRPEVPSPSVLPVADNDDDDDDVCGGGEDFWAGGIDDVGFADNDDDDDDGNAFSGDNARESDENGLLRAAHHVEKIDIAFDKRPKQVDVRALKTTLWENVQQRSRADAQEGFVDSFSDIVATLPRDNPAGRPEDISVHLCFICMLHLANENNLTIKGEPSLSELRISGA